MFLRCLRQSAIERSFVCSDAGYSSNAPTAPLCLLGVLIFSLSDCLSIDFLILFKQQFIYSSPSISPESL